MKILTETHPINSEILNQLDYYNQYYSNEKLLFFDIETTGFVAKNTTLYLIGVLWFDEKSLHIQQWFNDLGNEENLLIESFIDFCKNFSGLIHFNGCGFDLPYLKQKAAQYDIAFSIDETLYQIDIFKEMRQYKTLLMLDNMKQTSVEQFLDIQRQDTYTGGELINIYQRYVTKPNEEMENLLLLHNHDDLIGMIKISPFLNYKSFVERTTKDDISSLCYEIDETEHKLCITYNVPPHSKLKKRLSVTHQKIYINAMDTHVTMQIPITHDQMKHYYSDYKNYYYLPNEDIALHKSVATYVEPTNRVKANKQNCYTKAIDKFIPYNDFHNTNLPIFQYDFSEKQRYIQLTTFLSDNEFQLEYIIHVLHSLISKKS